MYWIEQYLLVHNIIITKCPHSYPCTAWDAVRECRARFANKSSWCEERTISEHLSVPRPMIFWPAAGLAACREVLRSKLPFHTFHFCRSQVVIITNYSRIPYSYSKCFLQFNTARINRHNNSDNIRDNDCNINRGSIRWSLLYDPPYRPHKALHPSFRLSVCLSRTYDLLDIWKP